MYKKQALKPRVSQLISDLFQILDSDFRFIRLPAMDEEGRSRSSLSSLASSQRTLSANSSPTSRLVIPSAGLGNYTETWISKNSSSISPEMDTCRQIKNIEEIIDELQVKAEKCRKSQKRRTLKKEPCRLI
ncbi:hypothetical protein AVEN_236601-1 [Araneus ventricosus]|uniref:Uncharacterized protein n=1 Tax=Araneus ventricosus TaxID=182803 RepID=A0A4Y2Q0N6_ARAVE|nr:hypothetical protein AVEN_236601-1 [Araneus ventricosus]